MTISYRVGQLLQLTEVIPTDASFVVFFLQAVASTASNLADRELAHFTRFRTILGGRLQEAAESAGGATPMLGEKPVFCGRPIALIGLTDRTEPRLSGDRVHLLSEGSHRVCLGFISVSISDTGTLILDPQFGTATAAV